MTPTTKATMKQLETTKTTSGDYVIEFRQQQQSL